MKTVEIEGIKYILRPWTLSEWRRMQGELTGKTRIEECCLIVLDAVLNENGDKAFKDQQQIDDTLPLPVLDQLADEAFKYNFPFVDLKQAKSSPNVQT